jgi:peptide/nickel transport system permease protein
VLTVLGIIAGTLIGGAILVEQVFVIPGLGAMLVTGVLQKDFPAVQGVALVLTFAVIAINLLVDIGCASLDPRIR